VGPPTEVAGVLIDGKTGTTLTWTALDGSAVYDIASSTISDLQSHGNATATCLSNDVTGTGYVDGQADPAVGDGYYYLIRAQSLCGTGTYGVDSAGVERTPIAACP